SLCGCVPCTIVSMVILFNRFDPLSHAVVIVGKREELLEGLGVSPALRHRPQFLCVVAIPLYSVRVFVAHRPLSKPTNHERIERLRPKFAGCQSGTWVRALGSKRQRRLRFAITSQREFAGAGTTYIKPALAIGSRTRRIVHGS